MNPLKLEIVEGKGTSPLDFLNSLHQWLENQKKEGKLKQFVVSMPSEEAEIVTDSQILFADAETKLDDIEAGKQE